MKKGLLFATAIFFLSSCGGANSEMKKMVESKLEEQAAAKGQEYSPVDFSDFYAISFKENSDSLAKVKGMTPMGADDIYWKAVNKGGWIAGNINENPFCDLSKVKETAIEMNDFIKREGLTPNCYFVLHKYKISDKDLGAKANMVAGFVIGPPGEDFAGVLHSFSRSIPEGE